MTGTEPAAATPASSASAADPVYDVVLLAGQSNMLGLGKGPDNTADAAPDPRVSMWDPSEGIVQARDPLVMQMPDSNAGVGLGLTLGKSLLQNLPSDHHVLLVGTAVSGTAIFDGNWKPGGPLFGGAVQRVNAAMAAAGPGARFLGIAWHQGEQDIQEPGGAAAYQRNLDSVVNGFRSYIAGAGPTTPFVGGELSQQWTASNGLPTETKAVLAALQGLPDRIPHTGYVASDGLTSNTNDSLHFNALSQRELGRRYAARFAELLSVPQGALKATPGNLSFSGISVGSRTASQNLTVTNADTKPVTVSNLTATGDFSQTNTCSTLQAGASCSVTVTFKPTSAGTRSGTLTISSNAQTGPTTVALRGLGVDATTNVAAGQPTSASSSTGPHLAPNFTDPDPSSYWQSRDGSFPQWAQVDLGKNYSINKVVLRLPPASAWSTRTQTLSVMGSTDGSTFSTILGPAAYTFALSTNNNTATLTFDPITARYVRVGVTANSGSSAAQLSDFGVFTGSGSATVPAPGAVSLRAEANDKYVSADNGGLSPLIANRGTVGSWESFNLVSNSDGSVSLRAEANDKYVSADNGGLSPLIANRGTVGPWESFNLVSNSDGSVSLRAEANNKYVTAPNSGNSPLIASSATIGTGEKFDLFAGDIDMSRWYALVNRGSDACVDASSATVNGTPVQLQACTGIVDQQWRISPGGNGYYTFQNRAGKVWDVAGGEAATQPGARLQTWQYGGATNQQFKPVSLGNGYYQLEARHSGLCLNVPGAFSTGTLPLEQNTCTGAAAQAFKLVPQNS